MSTFIKIPYPSTSVGTLVNTYSIKSILKGSNTTIVIHFDDSTIMTCTATADTTTNTLDAFNDALELSRSQKSNGPSSSTVVTMPSGKSVTGVEITVLT